MSPRKRWVRAIGISLAIGFMTTVLIAWVALYWPRGSALLGPTAKQGLGLSMADDGAIWVLSRGENWWHRTTSYWHMQVSGRSMSIPAADYEAKKFDFRQLPRHQRPESLDDLYMTAWYHEVGWPMKALTCAVHWKQQVRNADILYRVEGGMQFPRDAQFNPRVLPLRPLWPGFLVNTLLFAGVSLAAMVLARKTPRRGNPPARRCA